MLQILFKALSLIDLRLFFVVLTPGLRPIGVRMEIKVNFLDNLRLEAKFDDFTVIADQPIRYKGRWVGTGAV